MIAQLRGKSVARDDQGPLALRAVLPPNTYEIHYVRYGLKRVKLHDAYTMSELDAWIIAARDSGVPESYMPSRSFLSLLWTIAEGQGVSKVRWNLCPRTIQNQR